MRRSSYVLRGAKGYGWYHKYLEGGPEVSLHILDLQLQCLLLSCLTLPRLVLPCFQSISSHLHRVHVSSFLYSHSTLSSFHFVSFSYNMMQMHAKCRHLERTNFRLHSIGPRKALSRDLATLDQKLTSTCIEGMKS